MESQFRWDENATPSDIKNFYKLAHNSISGLLAITPTTASVEGGAYMVRSALP